MKLPQKEKTRFFGEKHRLPAVPVHPYKMSQFGVMLYLYSNAPD